MNLLKTTGLCLLFFIDCSHVRAAYDEDTLKVHPILKRKEYYQPVVLKTSPTALLWGGIFPFTSEFRFMAEITSTRTQSEQVGISYLCPNFFLATAAAYSSIQLKASGWRLQYAHKFYLIRKEICTLWILRSTTGLLLHSCHLPGKDQLLQTGIS